MAMGRGYGSGLPLILFGAFCLWGALEDGLPKNTDMRILTAAGVVLVGLGIWSLRARAEDDKAAQMMDRDEHDRPNDIQPPV